MFFLKTEDPYDVKKADVFSFGCTIFSLFEVESQIYPKDPEKRPYFEEIANSLVIIWMKFEVEDKKPYK